MTKTYRQLDHTITKEKKDRLLQLMDSNKVSLVRASQMLGISYYIAKSILLIYNTPRKNKLMESISPSTSRNEQKGKEKEKIKTKRRMERIRRIRSPAPSPPERPKKAKQSPFCRQCNCSCCPYVRERIYAQQQKLQMQLKLQMPRSY